jgi:hypothetical protein
MSDLFGCENQAVSQINLNAFLKLLVFQVANELSSFSQKGLGDGAIESADQPASIRLFAYLLRLMVSEYEANQTIINYIALIFIKPKIHRELFKYTSEQLRPDGTYLAGKRFSQGIFSDADPDVAVLSRALLEGRLDPSNIFPETKEVRETPVHPQSG